MSDRVVVVGGGTAARSFIEAYREAGGEDPLTMCSADDRLPYFRPALTKELLRGELADGELPLKGPEWYAAHEAEVWLDCPVTALDLAERVVDTAHGRLPWTTCVLATGSSAKPLPAPGVDAVKPFSIRSASDSYRVIDAVSDGAPVVVIGSGFVGCEAAASIRARGNEVTMISQEALPQQGRLGGDVAQLIGGWIRDAGIELLGGRQVRSVERSGGEVVVHLDDGVALAAAHLLVATGASPNTALAEAAGLAADGGIAVDSSMRTAIPGLFAIGDIALAFNESAGRPLRVEHWGDAEGMGQVAGIVAAGHQRGWSDVPGFWSSIAGNQLKYVAWGDGFDAVVVERSADGFTAWYGKDGLTAGVLTFNHDDDLDLGRTLIRSNTPFRA